MAGFKPRERIGPGRLHLMMMTAMAFDAFQAMFYIIFVLLGLIPIVGFGFGVVGYIFSALISIVGYVSLWIWFKMSGVSFNDFVDLRIIAWYFGTAILEATFLGILPLFTLGVIRTAYLVRKKDEEYNKKHAPSSIALPQDRLRHQRVHNASLRSRSASGTGTNNTSTGSAFSKTNAELARRVSAS